MMEAQPNDDGYFYRTLCTVCTPECSGRNSQLPLALGPFGVSSNANHQGSTDQEDEDDVAPAPRRSSQPQSKPRSQPGPQQQQQAATQQQPAPSVGKDVEGPVHVYAYNSANYASTRRAMGEGASANEPLMLHCEDWPFGGEQHDVAAEALLVSTQIGSRKGFSNEKKQPRKNSC